MRRHYCSILATGFLSPSFNLRWLISLTAVAALLAGCPRNQSGIVPNLYALTPEQAGDAIRDAGFTVGNTDGVLSDTLPQGSVIDQSPAAGASAPMGTPIDITFSLGSTTTTVPDVRGETESSAENLLNEARLEIGTISYDDSSTVASGRVISQSPNAGTTVGAFTSVAVVISNGPPLGVIVPDVVGATESSARTTIQSANLVVGTVTEEFSQSVEAGRVISQNPSSGDVVDSGSAVTLVISLGPSLTREVPDLRGKTQAEAETALENLDLILGTVTEEYSETVPLGRIISHTPLAGAVVNTGAAISIVVSIGPPPIPINDVTELQKIGNDGDYPINGNYILVNDINGSATASWDSGKGFDPIGSESNRFTGRFDGAGFSITGITISRMEEDYVGVFGYLGAGAIVKDVLLTGGSVAGHDYVGALCGASDANISATDVNVPVIGNHYVGGLSGHNRGVIEDSSVAGAVSASGDRVGGVCGYNQGGISNADSTGIVSGRNRVGGVSGYSVGTLTACSSTGDVVGDAREVGGLVGYCEGNILECSSDGDVLAGDDDVGGLIGENRANVTRSMARGTVNGGSSNVGGLIGQNYGTLLQCVATGSTYGGFRVGGLVGVNLEATLNQCAARGSVTGDVRVGGLVGSADEGRILQCFSLGMLVGNESIGGLVGYISSPPQFTASFWDIQTSGTNTSAGGEGWTTVQMKAQSNFEAAGWDFAETWGITDGFSYPYLQWAGDILD